MPVTWKGYSTYVAGMGLGPILRQAGRLTFVIRPEIPPMKPFLLHSVLQECTRYVHVL